MKQALSDCDAGLCGKDCPVCKPLTGAAINMLREAGCHDIADTMARAAVRR